MDKRDIKNLRRRLGWSQSDLARRLGEDSEMVAALEEGRAPLSSKILNELELIERQAEQCSEEVVAHALADQVLDHQELEQITNNDVTATL